MARNIYKNTIKELLVADTIILQAEKERVYIATGHIIVTVDRYAYDIYFRPASGVFIELEEGIIYSGSKNNIPTAKEFGSNIVKLYNQFKECSHETISVSPFLMEYTDRKKKKLIRMLTGNGYYVQVDEKYFQVAAEIGFNNFLSKGNSRSAVFNESGNYGIVILPMVVNQDSIDNFINAVK